MWLKALPEEGAAMINRQIEVAILEGSYKLKARTQVLTNFKQQLLEETLLLEANCARLKPGRSRAAVSTH
jgi:hypothetical protein